MESILNLMANNHRQCDEYFVAVEQAVANHAWDNADAAFSRFREAVLKHLAVEESILFPAFETQTGMSMGPTQVMRGEHAQMRELIEASSVALAERDADDYSGYSETLLIMTQQHNIKEENILYPMCDQHLTLQLDILVPRLKNELNNQERKA